jgi:hypothetical protein
VNSEFRRAAWFPLIWGLGLVILFSFLPISLQPFKFVTKQANYLIMFFAPLAILAGCLLARLPARAAAAASVVVLAGNTALAAMEQQTIRVFTANSHAANEYAEVNADAAVYGSVNNANIGSFRQRIGMSKGRNHVEELALLERAHKAAARPGGTTLAFIDPETLGWSPSDARLNPAALPGCWQARGELEPTGFGAAHALMAPFMESSVIEAVLPDRIYRALDAFYEPKPGKLYAVPADDPWCAGQS